MDNNDKKEGQVFTNKAYEGDDLGTIKCSSNVQVMCEDEIKRLKFLIIKNVALISFAFFLLFTSYNAISILQSSINPNIGTTALMALYVMMIISSAFMPTLLINKIKVKWTITFSILTYSVYFVAQFYPTAATLIPTAMILGVGAAPLWAAKCTYLMQVSRIYADLVHEELEVIIVRFFGIFFCAFQSSMVIGNLISSTVLTQQGEVKTTEELDNYCGAKFCPDDGKGNITLLHPPDNYEINIMFGIYLACSILASFTVAAFVDPLKSFIKETPSDESILTLVSATFKQLGLPYQVLLIPLTIYSGLEQMFLTTVIPAAWVTCGIGVHMVGYTIILYGCMDSIASIGFTPLVKIVGRVPIFTGAALLNAAMCIVMLTTSAGNQTINFTIVAFWGISDAVWQTQINAYYGVLFSDSSTAAYSNYRLWECIGCFLVYLSDGYLCAIVKIYLLIGALIIGIIGFYIIEYMEYKRKKENY